MINKIIQRALEGYEESKPDKSDGKLERRSEKARLKEGLHTEGLKGQSQPYKRAGTSTAGWKKSMYRGLAWERAAVLGKFKGQCCNFREEEGGQGRRGTSNPSTSCGICAHHPAPWPALETVHLPGLLRWAWPWELGTLSCSLPLIQSMRHICKCQPNNCT